jgi:membrane-bound ClpP family serine protease
MEHLNILIPVIFAIVGLILIFLEFFLPGIVMGIVGGFLLFSSVIIMIYLKHSAYIFVIYIVSVLFLLFFTVKLALSVLKKKKKNIFLQQDQEGFLTSSFDESLIGKQAKAITDLKPSGHIFVDNKFYQAISRDEYIEKGSRVHILKGQGAYFIVTKEKEDEYK